MARELRAIDSDGHLTEPGDLWENYIDPKYRDTCPKITVRPDGGADFRVDDRIMIKDFARPLKPGVNTSVTFGARTGEVASDLSYHAGEQGGFDPHERIKWLDREGFDATVLFPTMALGAIHGIIDPDRQEAVANAYNRYVADFCKPYPDRLFGAALMPTLSLEGSLREMRNAKELGLNAATVRPNPVLGRGLHDPYFYPLWELAQDLDLPIAVHGLAGSDNLGMDRFDAQTVNFTGGPGKPPKCHSFSVEHCYVHTAEMMAAATSFVMAGICDKFPKLRVAFVESGATWMPGYIDRMDRHFDDVGMNDTGLTTRPSEIFQRQCYMSFEPVERSISVLAEYLGPNKLMIASDYPHGDGFPNAIQSLRDLKLKPDVEAALLSQGFKEWYGLH
ncbi:amidohydrolase family protein [Sphingomonas histidinilytica]|jgi:predicted TIM-barrel fold metal-dependent hydrolase|uniref:Predicted metal-dependent hydrolase, TIM-barrel fold n=1 Tax=Rhizorhabdus histidinilytica TaxID=439228 RepID=A0A1T5EJ25_9SPHN|nr:amidohydrolase family protein [Rhizorhabdus histidinilytica]MBO9380603.1 amidohydrolase family protein [Rhizorhabdus histidinilytica]QEH76778.1 amidohydrolase [Sphingomonas sp. C8-2]SKB83897.1 Predicted metal-dependent hydrolase, TIM-barrel fold [Rhizorhabdus histidinilytica]